jgi:hypothetical protein
MKPGWEEPDRCIPPCISRFPASLLKAAQLAAMDLDTTGVAVFGNLTLGNLVFSRDSECLWAGNLLCDSFCPEGLFDLVSIHGITIGYPAS